MPAPFATSRPLFSSDRRGGVTVVFAISLMALVVISAMTLTSGDAYNVRNQTQGALDSAVLAGTSLPYGATDPERIEIAKAIYASDRSWRGSSTAELTVQSRPAAQFRVSDTKVFGLADVALKSPFLGVLGKDQLDIRVASAARKMQGAPACVLGLDPSEPETIDLNGRADVRIRNCAALANSRSGKGMRQVGNSRIEAKELGVTGGYTGSNYSPTPITGVSPIPDPYAHLPLPLLGPCHPMSGAKLQQANVTLEPGTYCGGIQIMAQSTARLLPGIYIFKDGPLQIDAQSRVSGENVMLAFLGEASTLYIYAGSSLEVTSPQSGTYANIQFFGDRRVYGPKQESLWMTVIGDSRLSYDGVSYTPMHHIWWAGGSEIRGRSPSYIAVAKKLWFQDSTRVSLALENDRGVSVPDAANLEYGAALFR